MYELNFDRFLNLVYWWSTREAESQEQVDKFDRRLWTPPAGYRGEIPQESPWSAEAETSAFSAFAGEVMSRPGTGRSGAELTAGS